MKPVVQRLAWWAAFLAGVVCLTCSDGDDVPCGEDTRSQGGAAGEQDQGDDNTGGGRGPSRASGDSRPSADDAAGDDADDVVPFGDDDDVPYGPVVDDDDVSNAADDSEPGPISGIPIDDDVTCSDEDDACDIDPCCADLSCVDDVCVDLASGSGGSL